MAAVKRLLAAGAKLETRDANGWVPLHTATLDRTGAMMELLLKHKADPNVRDRSGGTPLHLAALYGYKRPMAVLLAQGANINAQDNQGQTPIYLAASSSHVEVVKLLAAKGAILDPVSVLALGRLDLLAALLKKNPKLATDGYGDVSLFASAVAVGNLEAVMLLLKHGADVNEGEDGFYGSHTPLQIAAVNGHVAVTELLLKHGAKVDASSHDGSPLHEAARHGQTAVAKVLLKHKATVDLGLEVGRTPLTEAAEAGHGAWWNCCSRTRPTSTGAPGLQHPPEMCGAEWPAQGCRSAAGLRRRRERQG